MNETSGRNRWPDTFSGYKGLAAAIISQANQDWDILQYSYKCPICGAASHVTGAQPKHPPRCGRSGCPGVTMVLTGTIHPYRQGIKAFVARGKVFPAVCELLAVEPGYIKRLLVRN